MGVGISIGIELGIEPGIGIELELDSCSMSNRSISEFFLFVFLALLCFFCAFFLISMISASSLIPSAFLFFLRLIDLIFFCRDRTQFPRYSRSILYH